MARRTPEQELEQYQTRIKELSREVHSLLHKLRVIKLWSAFGPYEHKLQAINKLASETLKEKSCI